ncbi:hypothetical protein B0J18DRAFT_62340 [Chaetomium sp. MPI-SDFR-AT-0129]|nr:hypothetical protein B0J18DRAFT_62340 [Chaetomium sp. MPI-SDFR-AT-0129]
MRILLLCLWNTRTPATTHPDSLCHNPRQLLGKRQAPRTPRAAPRTIKRGRVILLKRAVPVPPGNKWRNESANGRDYWKIFDAVVANCRPPSYTEALSKVPAALTTDFPKMLLAHARLYIFADCYQVAPLTKMALFRLGRELQKTYRQPVQAVSVEAIVSLLEFCYAEPRPGRLRSLVGKYAACSVERLCKDAGFQALLKSQAELGADLVKEMVARFVK